MPNRILFVDQFAGLGGGQRILLDLVEHFRKSGFEVAVALPEHGPLTDHLKENQIATFSYTLPTLAAGRKGVKDIVAMIRAHRQIRSSLSGICDEFRPDLIFCNGPRPLPAVTQVAASKRIKLICAVHLIFRGVERTVLNLCLKSRAVGAVTFCSSLAAAPFEKAISRKTILIGNWVSPKFESAPKTTDAKELFNWAPSSVVVGVLGRISKNKGQAFFLEACVPLLDKWPELHLAIAGGTDHEDEQEEQNVRSLIPPPKPNDRVRLLGPVANPIDLLDALDVLVVPSLWEEPFGLVAVEGMARSLPIIATKSGALQEIVKPGATGILIEKDANSLRAAVEDMLLHEGQRKRMGEEGRKVALERYGAGLKMDAILEIARELIGGGTRAEEPAMARELL